LSMTAPKTPKPQLPMLPAAANLRAEMCFLKATQAPVIFFEVASTFGVHNEVGNITLVCGQHTTLDGLNISEPRVVAHLRFPKAAAATLRAALDHIEGRPNPALNPEPKPLPN
jgi:hypothetical protein